MTQPEPTSAPTTDPTTEPTSAPNAEPVSAAAREQSSEIDAVIDAALELFARDGYADTKMEAVAKRAGISKRMVHYHFGDKKGLYVQALARAVERLTPPQAVLERQSEVPVEGMRRFVDSMFHSFLENPDSVRLLLKENLAPALNRQETAAQRRSNEVTLNLERILLFGQDAGAFRPGISAEDVLSLIVSLCEFHVVHAKNAYAIGRVDFANRRNVDGMRRLIIDTVLAFLTSNIPHSGYESYLVSDAEAAKPAVTAPQVYEVGESEIY